MTNEQMERRLASAVEKTAPDDVNGVLSRCEERKGTERLMTEKKTAMMIKSSIACQGIRRKTQSRQTAKSPVKVISFPTGGKAVSWLEASLCSSESSEKERAVFGRRNIASRSNRADKALTGSMDNKKLPMERENAEYR